MAGLIYFDASALMRLVEGTDSLQQLIRSLAGSATIVTSVISFTECLPRPLRDGDSHTAALYSATLLSPSLRLVAIDHLLCKRAAEYRARFNLRTPDAIHFAAAAATGCEQLITSDSDFRRCDGTDGVRVTLIPAV